MKSIKYINVILVFLIISGCITQFIPETEENQELLVVEGLITDKPEVCKIKLSTSMRLGKKAVVKPLKGCTVFIEDDLSGMYLLKESQTPGVYVTEPADFQGRVGHKYTLHINTNNSTSTHYSYQSLPMEMKAVPPIDSLYFERTLIADKEPGIPAKEGCQIYLDTHDPSAKCKYYRWDYNETWEFRLPFSVPVNNPCWISNDAVVINIKNTNLMSEDIINRFPLHFISNETDRLKVKYSILVNQYSLNEDEFNYWNKLENVIENVGTLYDVIPASVIGNISCIEDPSEKVLGYFSVSAKASVRMFIKEYFSGIVNKYSTCIEDTIFNNNPIPGLNVSVWILEQSYPPEPPLKVITYQKGCADCTVRGSLNKPEFWDDDK